MSEGKRIVEEFFRKSGVEKKILSYEESTHDSHRAAQAIGVLLGQIAKSILFMADGKPVLVVISGEKKVNMKELKNVLSARKLKFAGEDDVRENTGFGIGAVSPVGLPERVLVLLDKSLRQFEKIYPAAGSSNNMFESTFEELKDLTGVREVDLSQDF